ncbi:MAG TPA: flagellar type III secretion system pore protein FliP, partial [Steroidobacteraceae bacterium]|nr:flagellar type III secretion system pore protein FliP [Steroidobacteraceae bacterium]
MKRALAAIALGFAATAAAAAEATGGIPAVSLTVDPEGVRTYSVTIQILLLMTALTVLPALILCMTSFTRIVVVLAILRQALGTPSTPPNQVLIGLSLFLTLFVMSPVLGGAWNDGVAPYLDGRIEAKAALERTIAPLRSFMLKQTRESDLKAIGEIAGQGEFADPDAVPLTVLIPTFITSELKSAFQIGFAIFLPFLVIDLVVASVLMSMGMMMLSPMLVSLPFKIMLFVLVDGWTLLVGMLAASFQS